MRKKWNKAYITGIAVVVCGLAITGCSGNNEAQTVSEETVDETIAEPEAEDIVGDTTEDTAEDIEDTAEDTEEDVAEAEPEEEKEYVPVSEIEVGDVIDFGSYDQDGDLSNGAEALQFIVLDKQEDSLLLLSRLTIDHQPYHEEWEDATWETSTIRSWLNDTFYEEVFSEEEQAQIQEVELSNPDNPRYGTTGGNETTDQIFLLSLDEVDQYLPSNESRKAGITEAYNAESEEEAAFYVCMYGYALDGYDYWWLRSPGNEADFAAVVSNRGAIYSGGEYSFSDLVGVRPALWVKSDKFVPDPDMADEKILLTEDEPEIDQDASEDEKLYQQFLHNEIPVTEISYHSVYGTKIENDRYYEDFLESWSDHGTPEMERIDLDNDGKDELAWNESAYGYTIIDARDGKLYILAEADGTASYCRYNIVDGEAWISNSDATHQGRDWYHLRKFNGNGEAVDQFDLDADFWDNGNGTYDETSDFTYRGEKITMEEFEELRMRYLGI